MSDPRVTGPSQGLGEDRQYDLGSMAALQGLREARRPWQVLLTWTGADPPSPALHEVLGRILDLFPATGCLTVHTANGSIMATRDFRSGYANEVDELLTELFQANPTLTGVTFPATPTRPAHTATPDDPFWSPLGKAGAAIMASMQAGRITPEQAGEQFRRLYAADAAGAGAVDPTSPGA